MKSIIQALAKTKSVSDLSTCFVQFRCFHIHLLYVGLRERQFDFKHCSSPNLKKTDLYHIP